MVLLCTVIRGAQPSAEGERTPCPYYLHASTSSMNHVKTHSPQPHASIASLSSSANFAPPRFKNNVKPTHQNLSILNLQTPGTIFSSNSWKNCCTFRVVPIWFLPSRACRPADWISLMNVIRQHISTHLDRYLSDLLPGGCWHLGRILAVLCPAEPVAICAMKHQVMPCRGFNRRTRKA